MRGGGIVGNFRLIKISVCYFTSKIRDFDFLRGIFTQSEFKNIYAAFCELFFGKYLGTFLKQACLYNYVQILLNTVNYSYTGLSVIPEFAHTGPRISVPRRNSSQYVLYIVCYSDIPDYLYTGL